MSEDLLRTARFSTIALQSAALMLSRETSGCVMCLATSSRLLRIRPILDQAITVLAETGRF